MEQDRRPPVIDMTPEGDFREPAPRRATALDRMLGRIGGVALLVAVAAGGLVLAAVAFAFAVFLIPVVLAAGAVAAGTLWWRLRRLRKQGGAARFVVIRR
jgi:hypothetical protein